MPVKLYPAVIHKDAESDYGVTIIDFPATCSASTPEKALQEAALLLSDVVPDYIKDGLDLPAPTPIEAIPYDLAKDAILVSLIMATIPAPAKRISVTMDPDLIERIDAITSNRSAFLSNAARKELDIRN